MKIPERILSERLQREVQVYEEQEQLYENSKEALYQAQFEYMCDAENAYPFLQAIDENQRYYDRVVKLQQIINDIIEQIELQRTELPLLDTRKLYKTAVVTEQDIANEPVYILSKRKNMSYKEFRAMFLEKIAAERRKEEEARKQEVVKDKTINYPVVQLKLVYDNTQLIQENAEFKRRLKYALKDGTYLTDNVYAERRREEQQRILFYFNKRHEKQLKQREEEAKQFAREITRRDLAFFEKAKEEERQRREIERTMAISIKAQRTIQKTTSENIETAVAQQYIPDHLRPHVSKRADKVVPASFGLGRSESIRFIPEIYQEQKVYEVKIGKLDDILGVSTRNLDFRDVYSTTKRPQSRGQDKKKSGKTSYLGPVEDTQEDSSDDLEPVMRRPVEHYIQRKTRPLPVIRSPRVHSAAAAVPMLSQSLHPISSRSSFVCYPAYLYFCNFRQNESQELQVTVVNNSATLQSFKVLDIDEEYRGMFELHYTPGGMLAPGKSVLIRVVFTYNDMDAYKIRDVHTAIRIRHQDGVLELPISCFRETYKVQFFCLHEQARKAYDSFLADQHASFALNDQELASSLIEAQSSCLVDGLSDFSYYIVNTGHSGVHAAYSIDDACDETYQKASQIIKRATREQNERARTEHADRMVYAQNNVSAQFAQFQIEQQALTDKKKLKYDKNAIVVTEDFSGVTADTIEAFAARRAAEIVGPAPAELDSADLRRSAMVGFMPGTLFSVAAPECVLLDGCAFDAAEYKRRIYVSYVDKHKIQIEDALKHEIEEKKQTQLQNVDPRKKRPLTPPPGTLNFMQEDVYQQYFNEEFYRRMADLEQQFYDNFSYQTELLAVKQQDDTEMRFYIPPRSMLRIVCTQRPYGDSPSHFTVGQSVALFDARGVLQQKYALCATLTTYRSPIILTSTQLDFQTCFYGEYYNTMFGIRLVNQCGSSKFTGTAAADPCTISRHVHIAIPAALSQFVHVDQNELILNMKNAAAEIKLKIDVPSKKALVAAACATSEEWAQIGLERDLFSAYSFGCADQLRDLQEQLEKARTDERAAIQKAEAAETQLFDLKSQKEAADSQKRQDYPSRAKSQKQNGYNEPDISEKIKELEMDLANARTAYSTYTTLIGELMRKLDETAFPGSYSVLHFTIIVQAAGQPQALPLQVRAAFSRSDITVNAGDVEMAPSGHLRISAPVDTAAYTFFDVQLRNNAAVPQALGVSGENGGQWRAEPFGGSQIALPGEQLSFRLLFRPERRGPFTGAVTCIGEFGAQLRFSVHAGAHDHQIVLSTTTPINETALEDSEDVHLQLQSAVEGKWAIAPSLLREIKTCSAAPPARPETPPTQKAAKNAKGQLSKTQNAVPEQPATYNVPAMPPLIEFLPSAGILRPKQTITMRINATSENVAALERYLEKRDSAGFSYVREYLPRDDNYYLLINIVLCHDTDAPPVACAFRFIIRRPVVRIVTFDDPSVPERPKTPSSKYYTSSGRSEKALVAVYAPQYARVFGSHAVLDFGKCPVGQRVKKQLRIESDVPFYVREASEEFYDAELTMLSFIDRTAVRAFKILTFQYVPVSTRVAREEVLLSCYADASCTQRLNDLHIALRGEGVRIELDVAVSCSVESAKDAKSAKDVKSAKPDVQGSEDTDSELFVALPPLNLHAEGEFYIRVASRLDCAFCARVRQVQRCGALRCTIIGQNPRFDGPSARTAVVKYRAESYTDSQTDYVHFRVESGDFCRIVRVAFSVVCGAETDAETAANANALGRLKADDKSGRAGAEKSPSNQNPPRSAKKSAK